VKRVAVASEWRIKLETRIALIGIIVEDVESVERLNGLLHEYGQYIIGRMGIPYREKGINIISVVVNAEQDIISTLAGKLGMIKGVNVKTVYSKK
jgi:putative iron-only hydrogenase system regulator